MLRILSVAFPVVAAVLLLAISRPNVEGCAAVSRENGPSISIAEESAIIVWDPVRKVQHFIRRAAFDTKSPDFAFLVPTPTTPDLPLKEVEDSIFQAMDQWILPRKVEQTRLRLEPLFCIFGCTDKKATMMVGESKDVRVLHEQKVGGFDAVVLEADNTGTLSTWLKDNGYSNDPELQSWLFPYIAAKWKITAFKITQDPASGQLAKTKAVRMTFGTDRPFFPYREPERKKDVKEEKDASPISHGQRLLRVFFISNARMEGQLGNTAWNAKVNWSDQLTDEQRRQLAKETGVPEDHLPAKTWMTTFEDRASPRPGTDEVYFDPAKDQTPIRPQFIHYNDVWIPADVVILGIAFLLLVVLPVGWKMLGRKPA